MRSHESLGGTVGEVLDLLIGEWGQSQGMRMFWLREQNVFKYLADEIMECYKT